MSRTPAMALLGFRLSYSMTKTSCTSTFTPGILILMRFCLTFASESPILIPKSDTSVVLKCAMSMTSDSVSSYCSAFTADDRSEEHTSELQSQSNLVCRLLLEKKKTTHPHR